MKKLWLIIALIAATAVATTGAANADHQTGTLYRGGNSGGGLVEFTVSEDGSSVLDFRYTALPQFCSIGEQLEPGPVPIVNHTFSFQANDFMSFFGAFQPFGEATGTVTPKTFVTSCGELTWFATVGLGGIAELPDVDAAPAEATDSSSRDASVVAGIAAALAVGLTLGGAAWYVKRRRAR